jgi:hypothetical protein
MSPNDAPNDKPVAPDPGPDSPETALVAVVRQAVSKIQEQSLLFVIAITALLIIFGLLASALGSSSLALIVVIIGVLALVAILGNYLFNKPLPPPPAVKSGATGSIDAPTANSTVSNKVFCSGTASGLGPDKHLWLVVEANRLVWPKEREVQVEGNGRWTANIYEEGATRSFRISLLLAGPEGHEYIRNWLDVGRPKGEYGPLPGIPDTERLDWVDGLRLSKSE